MYAKMLAYTLVIYFCLQLNQVTYSQQEQSSHLWHQSSAYSTTLRRQNPRLDLRQVKPTSWPVQDQASAQSRASIIMPPNNQKHIDQFNHQTQHNVLASTGLSDAVNLNQTEPQDRYSMTPSDGFFHAANLELALRQASGDESVFQPSPSIGIPRHQLDWYSQHNVPKQSSIVQDRRFTKEDMSTTTTTEQNNNIVQGDSMGMSRDTSSPTYLQPAHQKEYLTLNASKSSLPADSSTTPEINNQVTFEGPVTAPPGDDYYFSSSERLLNSEGKASNSWWIIGVGSEFDRASNLTRDDYLDFCDNSELLVSNKQRTWCRVHPRIMPIVARGLKIAIDECQYRFSSSRWNCSLVLHNSLADSKTQVFGEVMRHSNRERSFINAIIAAGLAHAMTKACSQGELPEECSCDKRIKSKNSKGKIEWVACSDDIDYGARFSRDFTDSTGGESDTAIMINTHNNEVGRRVFKSATDITCTCQGADANLCQVKRCWKHLSNFSDIGDELMKRYESATHVQPSNRDPHKLRPVKRGVRKPKRKDLVFIDESPDFCVQDSRLGVLGTQNRRCNSTSSGPDSCSLLCCGRGYQVFLENVEEDCNCKFVWCCHLKCDRCNRQITYDICN